MPFSPRRAGSTRLVPCVVPVSLLAALSGCGGLGWRAPELSRAPPPARVEPARPKKKPCVPSKEALPDLRKEVAGLVDKIRAEGPACVARALDYEPGSLLVSFNFEEPCTLAGMQMQGRARAMSTGLDETGRANLCVELDPTSDEGDKRAKSPP